MPELGDAATAPPAVAALAGIEGARTEGRRSVDRDPGLRGLRPSVIELHHRPDALRPIRRLADATLVPALAGAALVGIEGTEPLTGIRRRPAGGPDVLELARRRAEPCPAPALAIAGIGGGAGAGERRGAGASA